MRDDERSEHDANTSAVPGGRWSRLVRLGALAGGVAGSMLAEGTRQFAQGKRPRISDLLLTPANARRVADQLAQLRGAAMKFGQLLSMDAGDLLPPEFGAILARLRADARAMPMRQLASVLDANWGHGWDRHFRQFSFTPVAAASIGQVHLAQTKDGRRLAIKVQYPGVRQSIDSDVDNVATLLRISGLLPSSLDVGPLLREAKRQLHAEADYLGEGALLSRYAGLLADTPEFMLPEVHGDLTTESVLSMSCMGGVPVESLLHAPQAERDRVLGLLFRLLFREIFEFHLIQTDPNFANYRYDVASRRLILLDFGATRGYPAVVVDAYRRLMASAVAGDRQEMSVAASAIGYFGADIGERQRQLVLDVFLHACEPLRHAGAYDFGNSDLPARIRDAGLALSTERDSWHTPPADALFLHRKAGGLYLLAARLKARVDIRALFLPYASGQAPS
ncbi:MAG: AarF/ABC1/UbiB kinase family protein [Candidatus Accumulibacter phosphatis]|jgi:predicted unusual protein kinase regulating ubiquinone biosynthesis (AarF/ABC1/UbiB family)|uniref:AarF/ABC1/UbiB kinase family protein n=1 Tax=Candidatus Accumulibacter contiguus TaxID=2954381 RepID=A0ABX1TBT2_9PROT|nr:AarF/ABC1/UbiB kinase family protein [Candidatus Accumulibacter contiguus]NMQ07132.1 AarF/ABC1/UbiB kinase family protein [Candidatus Accumulibacter contiguus]